MSKEDYIQELILAQNHASSVEEWEEIQEQIEELIAVG